MENTGNFDEMWDEMLRLQQQSVVPSECKVIEVTSIGNAMCIETSKGKIYTGSKGREMYNRIMQEDCG